MNELVSIKQWFKAVNVWWAGSLGLVVSLVVGALIGILYVESRIINDCKFINGFRIDSQSFTCNRKM